MKKFYFFAALIAGTVLTSCTSEDDLALSPPEVNVEDGYAPIVFSSLKNNITRADITGKAAADSLGNKFVVFGYKGEQTLLTPAEGSVVFDNYLVKYTENTANTTESNTANWEYVLENDATVPVPIKHATDHGITKQTIKYWDYSKTQYDFIAWSTGKKEAIYEGTPADGQVLVSTIAATPATGDNKGLAAAYTFTGKAVDLKDCYIADLVTVNKSGEPGYGEVTGYNKPVTLRFRQLGTKVRIGIYETVPGYSVKNMKFYTTGNLLEKDGDNIAAGQIVDNATIFSAAADIYTEGTYTVSFPTVDKPDSVDNNQAHITFAAKPGVDQTTIVDWGTLNYTIRESGEKDQGKVYLGRTSNTASYAGDPANNYYEFYLPNETGANLNLRVDFTLESIDGSGEIIEVKNAKAQVPSIYTTWKPGFAYTYLFKISDKTNGRTGVYDPTQADDATINSDPAGLYPITFDAVVVNAEDGNNTQETITLVATPSITTYQQNSTVVNADEYTVNEKDIFVTVNDNATNGTNDLLTMGTDAEVAGGAALYILESGMTEAEVINALTYQDDDHADGTIKGRSGKVLTIAENVSKAADLEANKWLLTDSVIFGADGNAIKVATNQALRFTPSANTTYAFVYTEKASDKDTIMYQALAFDKFEAGQTKYRYAYLPTTSTGSYTDDKGTEDTGDDETINSYDAQKGEKYFTESGGTYSLVVEPFIGQGVGNLYLDNQGTTIAKGYAVSGVDYYYTTDDGQTYTKAHPVAYGTSWATGLYVKCEVSDTYPDGYMPASGEKPADGTAYYYKKGTDYIYCVFLPQQVNDMYVLDTDEKNCVEATETTAVVGQTYFDMYNKNNAVRYAKVIKVQ